MTGEEIIVTFKEPWYNDYNKRLYTQLSEQMIREEIERVHKEPIITNTAFDMVEGIEAAITAPNVILHYGWQDMPINNIQQFRVRFSFVNQSSENGEPFEYSDNATYFTITPRLEQGEHTYTKTLANPLKYYLEKLVLPNQDPYNTPVWIRFEGYMMLRQVSQITLAVDSQSEHWAERVTFPSLGRWIKMNNSGRVFRFTGGERDLNIELYTTASVQP